MFTTAEQMTADAFSICPMCLEAIYPGEAVVQEEDLSVVHFQHSTLNIPQEIGVCP